MGEAKKKICYIVTIPDTIRSFFIPQIKYLSSNGFDITVVCSFDNALKTELGEDVHFMPINIPRGLSPIGMVRAIISLTRIFKRQRFDMIQYSTPNAAFCAALAGKSAGCKIRNYHLMGFRYLGAQGVGKKILKLFERITCRLSTSIECVSKSNLEFGINEKVFPSGKATVIWNGSTGGIDLERFDFAKRDIWRKQTRTELGLKENDFVFGFVGRITRDKGINEILKAYNNIASPSKLLFLGNAEGLDTLDSELLCAAKNNKNIIFHNAVPDVERYFCAIDVLLLPSYREGFGNVIIEAAAMGTPAIVSNIAGPIDAIDDGKTALTVSVRDADALESAMESILNNNPFNPLVCYEFAKTHFDSKELCRQIHLKRCELLK